MVRRRQVAVTNAIIVEASGLPAVGPVWTLKKVRLQHAITIFQDEGQNLIVK